VKTGAARRRGTPPNEVRIVGGRWKRSTLPVADRPGLRPTPDRVRETLFNWLGQDLAGWRCLDAFAGSGALGFEAASRGAASVRMLDADVEAVRLIDAARRRLQAEALHVERADALAWMARAPAATFDLVLLDPPFESGLLRPAIVLAAPLVKTGGWLYVESGEPLAEAPAGFVVHRRGRASAVHFGLLRRLDAVGG
jgi:16S rRNA (guanine(966)-N(2))-methyltransferase RsmD